MAKYRIVIPVVAQHEDLSRLLKQITNAKLLTIVNNFDKEEVQNCCNIMKKHGSRIINWPENRGCAASWNVGLKQIVKDKLDFVIILSPSCIWNNDVDDFVKEIIKAEKKEKGHMYIATGQHSTDTHAFAITRLGLEEIGYFDENLHPVYMEDADYYRRMELLGIERKFIHGLRKSAPLGGGVQKDPRIWQQYLRSAENIKAYYVKKWGKPPGREYFQTPYNDPELSAKDWHPVDRSKLIKPLGKRVFKELQDAGIV